MTEPSHRQPTAHRGTTLGVQVRTAQAADVVALASLSGELGYPTLPDALAARFRQVIGMVDQVVLVATVDDTVAGWIHGAQETFLEEDPRCEIRGLVVSQAHRRQRIGHQLVAGLERWARSRGLDVVSVRSNVLRAESHPFYEAVGYQRIKTQHVYRKWLSATTD